MLKVLRLVKSNLTTNMSMNDLMNISKLKDVINSDNLSNLCKSDFKIVTDAIFSDIGKLEEEIGDDVDVCFKLKKSLEMLGNDASVKDSILIKLFIKNDANVFQGTEFLDMNNSFIKKILQEGNCSDELKYDALLRWTKHAKKRKKRFSKLFKFIKLEALSLEFLKQKVQSEELVEKSPESFKSLMNAVFAIAEKKDSSETTTSKNAEERAPPGAAQMPTTSTSSNASGRDSGANQIPSSNPSSTNICRKCTKPIHDDERKWYFRCCNVYVHDDCLKRYFGDGWAVCPQCIVGSSPNDDDCSFG